MWDFIEQAPELDINQYRSIGVGNNMSPLKAAFYWAHHKYAYEHFKSMEMVFCYSPNVIACAAVQYAFDSQKVMM